MEESHKVFYFDKQPPPSFLATMEEYIREAPQSGYMNKRLVRKSDIQIPLTKLVLYMFLCLCMNFNEPVCISF